MELNGISRQFYRENRNYSKLTEVWVGVVGASLNLIETLLRVALMRQGSCASLIELD